MKAIRIGLIGSGFSAHLHQNSYNRIKGIPIEVAGVAAVPIENAKAFAEKFNIPKYYSDYRYLLDDDKIDIIDICAPNYIHKQICLDAASAKKNIICEKPLTGYFGDASNDDFTSCSTQKIDMYRKVIKDTEEILESVRRNDVKLGYAENLIYAPAIEKAKRLIKTSGGTILDLRSEESHSGSHASHARAWKTSGGGSLLRLGVHPIGVVIHLKHYEGIIKYGRPIKVKSVMAETANLTKTTSFAQEPKKWLATGWEDVEDWAAVFLTFDDGTKATVFSNDITLGGIVNRVEIFLSNGVIKCNLVPNDSCQVYSPSPEIFAGEYLAEKLETKAGWNFASPDEDWMRGYPQEMQDFVESVYYDRNPISDGELAKDVLQVVYASYISSEEGKRIELDTLI